MRFGGVHAVRDVNFTLAERELRCLIGPNGAGKSTFFKMLTGQLKPTSGAVLVRVDARYFRPTEVQTLLGDASKAREKLGWRPTVRFRELVAEMVASDLTQLASPDHARRAAAD